MNNKTTPSLQEPDELLPCPFCGYKAEMAESLCEAMYDICGDLSHPSQVCCPNCGCGAVGGRDVSDAITAWNTRNDTALQSEQAKNKRLTEALNTIRRTGFKSVDGIPHVIAAEALGEEFEQVLYDNLPKLYEE